MVDLNEIITYHQATSWSPDFRCTRRTALHLNWTKQQLPSGTSLRIIQPSYNVGYAPSAGTHDADAVFDVQVVGMEWWDAQRWLRDRFWAAMLRFPPLFSYHLHMISVGCNLSMVGYLVPSQLSDYRAHLSGLVGHLPDNSYHPAVIRAFDPAKVSATVDPPKPPSSPWDSGEVYVGKLHLGQIDSDSVRRLQYRLLHHQDIPARHVAATGNYGDGTRAAVSFFQRNMFVHADPDFRDGKQLTNRQARRLFGDAYRLVEK